MSPGRSSDDDCFAKLDAAFESRSSERKPASQQQSLDEFEDAFDALDDRLARAGSSDAAPNKVPTAGAPAPTVAAPSPAAAQAATSTAAAALPAVAASAAPVAAALSLDRLWRPGAANVSAVERLLGTLDNLALLRTILSTPRAIDQVPRDVFVRVFDDARAVCRDFGLATAQVRADFAAAALDEQRRDRLAVEVAELLRHMRHDVQSSSAWPIPTDSVWSLHLTLSDTAADAFPSAQAEVEEGGRCLALGRYTASVFHMLRAAAVGVRALAYAADAYRDDDTLQPDFAPLISRVAARIAGLSAWQGEGERMAIAAFFREAVDEARNLQHAARHLSDPSRSYDQLEATTVAQITRNFLNCLATRLNERTRDPIVGAG